MLELIGFLIITAFSLAFELVAMLFSLMLTILGIMFEVAITLFCVMIDAIRDFYHWLWKQDRYYLAAAAGVVVLALITLAAYLFP